MGKKLSPSPIKLLPVLRIISAVLLLPLLTSGCGSETPSNGNTPVDLASLVPTDNAVSGWEREGALKEFNSIDDLYDEINGEAQVYGDYGFRESVVQDFRGPGDLTIQLVISDQTDSEGASGLYDELGSGTEIEIPGLGEEGRNSMIPIVEFYFVEFWRDNFYVNVEINDQAEASQEIAEEFAGIVDDNIVEI